MTFAIIFYSANMGYETAWLRAMRFSLSRNLKRGNIELLGWWWQHVEHVLMRWHDGWACQ